MSLKPSISILFFIVILLIITITLFFVFRSNISLKSSSQNEISNSTPAKLNLLVQEYKKQFKNTFAGHYIDNEGLLNINIKGDISSIKNDLNFIKFQSVEHSLSDLNEIAKILSDNMADLEITIVEPNEKENKVYVYLSNLNENKINRIKKMVDSTAIEYIDLKLNIQWGK